MKKQPLIDTPRGEEFSPGTDTPAPPPEELVKEGMVHKDTFQTSRVDNLSNFVGVTITSKDGYRWGARGNGGMVVVIEDGHCEVDMVGTAEDISKMVATSLVKLEKMLGHAAVSEAMSLYMKRREQK